MADLNPQDVERPQEYGRTRAEVLVACWHEARYGPRRRKAWAAWLERVGDEMWHSRYDGLPDPPSRAEAYDLREDE